MASRIFAARLLSAHMRNRVSAAQSWKSISSSTPVATARPQFRSVCEKFNDDETQRERERVHISSAQGGTSRGKAHKSKVVVDHLDWQVRHMTTDLSALPDFKDDGLRKALDALLGSTWLKVEPNIKSKVESALASNTSDTSGKEALGDAWRSAQAIENFGGILTEMLMELNDLSGGTGEDVKEIPESTYKAMEAAYKKYCMYLDAFGDDEVYLKRKVENELGGVLLQIKQRCAGMEPKWGQITLLGTSGLSGSYIERRGLAG